MAERKTEMTVREAGHKGGSTTKQRYGEGFYEEIGKKGGKAGRGAAKRRSRKHYQQAALKRWAAEKKGGQS